MIDKGGSLFFLLLSRRKLSSLNPNPNMAPSKYVNIRRVTNSSSSAPTALFDMIKAKKEFPPARSCATTSPPLKSHTNMDLDTDLPPRTPSPYPSLASPPTATQSVSVTLRQNGLWRKLASHSIQHVTNDLPIFRLDLMRANIQKLPTLPRSISDTPRTQHTRRVRLIDCLITSAPILEHDDIMEINIDPAPHSVFYRSQRLS